MPQLPQAVLRPLWKFFLTSAAPCVSAALVLFVTSVANAAPGAPPLAPSAILRISIRGSINPATADYLARAIHRAETSRAQALIVELDTPGGLLSSTRTMAQAIQNSGVPIIFFVHPAGSSATSAGALLMLASHVAVMAPGTNVGAAHPVGSQGEDISGAAGEKATNDTAAFARGLAELRKRPPELAEGVVSKSKSYTAEEALRGGLIDLLAADLPELVRRLDGREVALNGAKQKLRTSSVDPAVIPLLEMTLGQRLLNFLAHPNIAAILMSLGLMLIYVELSHPGITIAGILGGISLLIAFMALQLLPIQTGGLVLVGIGVLLMLAEPFILSHGALAGGGVLAFVLGLIWMIDPAQTAVRVSPEVWVPLAVVMGSSVIALAWTIARSLRLSKETLAAIGGGGHLGLDGYFGKVEKLGPDARTGKALIRGEVWEIESDSPLTLGSEVEVLDTHGLVARVRPKSRE